MKYDNDFVVSLMATYDKVRSDVVRQADLAAHWYALAREARDCGDHARAIEMQERGAFRHRCAMTARFAHLDE